MTKIFSIRVNGALVYYDSFADVISHLKLASKQLRAEKLSVAIEEVDKDTPEWENLNSDIRNYYSYSMDLWKKAKKALPPMWDEWLECTQADYKWDFRFFLEKNDLPGRYELAA